MALAISILLFCIFAVMSYISCVIVNERKRGEGK
jgi:hypothetical protein